MYLTGTSGGRRVGGAPILECEHSYQVVAFTVGVDDDEPPPRSEHEAQFWRRGVERQAEARKALQWGERAVDSPGCGGGQAMGVDQVGERAGRRLGDDDSRHSRLELVERNGLASFQVCKPGGNPFASTRDPIEQIRDVTRVGIDLVERLGEKRASDRALLDVKPVGELAQTLGVFVVERNVDAVRCHVSVMLHALCTCVYLW